ncbi:MAG: hypothetical protein IJ737_06460, partial [Ruminococcus sp.]|nr:hypothetical protein [Ruminococcus sp.]
TTPRGSTASTQQECRLQLTARLSSTRKMLLDLQILGFGDWTDIDKFSPHKNQWEGEIKG